MRFKKHLTFSLNKWRAFGGGTIFWLTNSRRGKFMIPAWKHWLCLKKKTSLLFSMHCMVPTISFWWHPTGIKMTHFTCLDSAHTYKDLQWRKKKRDMEIRALNNGTFNRLTPDERVWTPWWSHDREEQSHERIVKAASRSFLKQASSHSLKWSSFSCATKVMILHFVSTFIFSTADFILADFS